MEGIPERKSLEASGGRTRDLQGDFDRIGAAGREKHFREVARCKAAKLLGEFYGGFAGEAARGEAEIVELLLDRGNQRGMGVADMVNAVAVEIHVSPAN